MKCISIHWNFYFIVILTVSGDWQARCRCSCREFSNFGSDCCGLGCQRSWTGHCGHGHWRSGNCNYRYFGSRVWRRSWPRRRRRPWWCTWWHSRWCHSGERACGGSRGVGRNGTRGGTHSGTNKDVRDRIARWVRGLRPMREGKNLDQLNVLKICTMRGWRVRCRRSWSSWMTFTKSLLGQNFRKNISGSRWTKITVLHPPYSLVRNWGI